MGARWVGFAYLYIINHAILIRGQRFLYVDAVNCIYINFTAPDRIVCITSYLWPHMIVRECKLGTLIPSLPPVRILSRQMPIRGWIVIAITMRRRSAIVSLLTCFITFFLCCGGLGYLLCSSMRHLVSKTIMRKIVHIKRSNESKTALETYQEPHHRCLF